jgi:hypothetical protein
MIRGDAMGSVNGHCIGLALAVTAGTAVAGADS